MQLTEKQLKHFKSYNEILPAQKTGDGLFSSIGSLISAGTNFNKSNGDAIKTGTQALSNVSFVGKNMNDAVKLNKKINAELEQLKRIKTIQKLNKKPVLTN